MIPIRYDPTHPDRAWIEGSDGLDENSFVWFSLGLLMFQMMGLALFALLLLQRLRSQSPYEPLPWWADGYKVVPLAMEAFLVGLFGGIDLLVGRT